MPYFFVPIFPLSTEAEIRAVLQTAASRPEAALALIAGMPSARQAFVFRRLA